MKILTGKPLKTISGIPHQIYNPKGWYQNVPFGSGVLNPRYKHWFKPVGRKKETV